MIAGLPYDAEIEYLESTGTQWIDSGIVGDQNTSVTVRFSGTFNNHRLFGAFYGMGIAREQVDLILYDTAQYGLIYRFGKIQQNILYKPTVNNRIYDVVCSKAGMTVNGGQLIPVPAPATDPFSTRNTLGIFGLHYNEDQWDLGVLAKLYTMQILQSGVLVRDFVPVRVGNVGYLYDRVTKKLFGNQGTGSFVLGPDVATPVMGLRGMKAVDFTAKDYSQDGLVAMWDGIENAGRGIHDSTTRAVDLCGTFPNISGFASMSTKAMVWNTNSYSTFAAAQWGSFKTVMNTGKFTLQFCVDLTRTGYRAQDRRYFCSGFVSGNSSRVEIYVDLNPNSSSYRKLVVNIRSGGSAAGLVTSATVVPEDGVVHSFTLSSNGKGEADIYGNTNGTHITSGVYPISSATSNLIIGKSMGNMYPYNAAGNWYSVRWYNRALSASEVAYNHRLDQIRFGLT